jgi:TetR/AcrR family transcriptional repressor of nem operon
MARPRQFDPDVVLDQAVDMFWTVGYRGLSVDDLVCATGVSRSSLYAVYGGKHQLFVACLERYRSHALIELLAGLERPDAGLQEIERYFATVIETLTSEQGRRGCLIVNSAAELGHQDPKVASLAEQHFEQLRRRFGRALANAKARGEIPASVDPQPQARALLAVANGLLVFGKAHPDRHALRSMVTAALQPLR